MFRSKQKKVDIEGFRLKHGRGEEMNHDIMCEDDIELDEYAAARKKGFNTEKMPNAKKMAYSSANELNRQAEAGKGTKDDYQ